MNTTVTNILKLFSQAKMSIQDMLYYVDVEKSAIQKSINQLNEFLETFNLNTIKKEKEVLDISRSIILRCFKGVKETLDKNGSNYDYVYGKGLKLNIIGEKEKGYFCKKLMKYFIENSYLSL